MKVLEMNQVQDVNGGSAKNGAKLGARIGAICGPKGAIIGAVVGTGVGLVAQGVSRRRAQKDCHNGIRTVTPVTYSCHP